jgi:glyoxylase-like metal-dependent hydrolase (beta-lactamase superfamily II)
MKYLIILFYFTTIFCILQHPELAPQQIVKVGKSKVTFINDDGGYIPISTMFPTSDSEGWKQFENIADEKGNLLASFGGFLIESGNKKILMDLGLGVKKVSFPGFGIVSGKKYLKNLEKAGLKPEDITDVFYTHLHMDHCGWTTIEKNGKQELTFPNANYWCSKEEWNFWHSIDSPSLQKNVIKPLEGKIKFIEEGQELAPHLTVHKAPGHTPGLSILKLEEDGKILWFTSDIFHSIIQFKEIHWYSVFDLDPKRAEITRKKFLPEFLKKNSFIANGHFSNSVFGKLTGEDGKLKWEPCLEKECELNLKFFKNEDL